MSCSLSVIPIMSTRDDPIAPDQMQTSPSPALLSYGCTPWRISSQRVADLYNSGTKLWTKRELLDIERQLEQSTTIDRFTLQCVDGKQVQVKNPLFSAQVPIWKPFVRYQEYWRLVFGEFDGPPGTFYCSYLVDWKNQVQRDFHGNVDGWETLFQTKQQLWKESATCESFRLQLRKLLASHRVTKIVCFGLGDIARKGPPVTVLSGGQGRQPQEPDLDTKDLYPCIMQHAATLTMAEETARLQGEPARVLSQDPQYTDDSKRFLRTEGFEIVGNFGAGGFAEVDDETIVFSAWTGAPVKQIIADIARPAAVITISDNDTVISRIGKPFLDPESPRTRQMWRGYESWAFPISAAEVKMIPSLQGLEILVRTGKDIPGPLEE